MKWKTYLTEPRYDDYGCVKKTNNFIMYTLNPEVKLVMEPTQLL